MFELKFGSIKRKWPLLIILITVFLAGCSAQGKKSEPVILTHIHGLGYTSDGQRLYIPAHDGLKKFSEGSWGEAPGGKHDYMGFAMTDGGFYSSGHPAMGSSLKNPLGIVKSTDEGKSLEHLDLYGGIDFHLLSASYASHTIYVFNPEPNERLDTVGLYYTQDEAKSWHKSEMKGLTEEPRALAVHPTDDAIVAVGTEKGLYLSTDYGNQFKKIDDFQVTAVAYSPEGQLYAGGYQEKGVMFKLNSESALEQINVPDLIDDAPSYIAINPVVKQEFVFSTFNKDIYLSADQGETWTKIVNQGEALANLNE
ncbi:F510_1955 family glycosylhydrolase [Paenibacillus sp. GCM10012307]|uniref:Glycosyl hydrolase n=1 Tax=Paenibacillus roseus TaxID=2798579 RepID=A0A934MVY0_9BACL|nr:glycosyl hydrolase [Paenibacillus roseus]MBJ6362592.1 glycosyl hydrolase [Paenibacillus roseus]